MMTDPEKLKSFLDVLVRDPSLKMLKDGTTFCNIGLSRAAALFEYHEFVAAEGSLVRPMTAREAISLIETENATSGDWVICSGKQAADYALRGGWAVAYMKVLELDPDTKLPTGQRAPHDHVATVYPAQMETSGSLHKEVPLVANIGKDNGVLKSSKAFPVIQGEAQYAILVA